MNTTQLLAEMQAQLNKLIVGKASTVRDALTCLLAGGHLLIEDIPGVGKTTLAHGLATTCGLAFARVQFTSDLMPSDLTGVGIYERQSQSFVFHPGPLFNSVLLADEINRANPKTQSALLEAMEEHQVSVDGKTHILSDPFFVIATQNPLEQVGTQALPESQLDRFLMRVSLGFPDRAAERALLEGGDRRTQLKALPAVVGATELRQLQQAASSVHASSHLLDYLQDLIDATRSGRWFTHGLSPRAGLAVLKAAKARALIEGRDYVAPDDLQAVWVTCTAHRLHAISGSGQSSAGQSAKLLQSVAIR